MEAPRIEDKRPQPEADDKGFVRGEKGRFAKGNRGRQKGETNHSTRVRNQLLACVGRHQLRIWKKILKDPQGFMEVLPHIVALTKATNFQVSVDKSNHKHIVLVNPKERSLENRA